MTAISDPIKEGVAKGWKVIDGSKLEASNVVDCDVVIVGTGAGGGITADLLTAAGLDVVMIEEGALKSSSDFKMREADAYPQLYQESAARKTKDRAINILQGRTVGGSTTVNWTSSFRTPPTTLAYWQSALGLSEFSVDQLAPYFSAVEEELGMAPWTVTPNENNEILRRGAALLGIPVGVIHRNVRACWNLGYCGMGCPTNAKQSMLITTIPRALDRGARLYVKTRATKLITEQRHVRGVTCEALRPDGLVARRRHRDHSGPPHRACVAAPSTHPRCCCAARRTTRTGWSARAPFSIQPSSALRQWRRQSMDSQAHHNRSTPITFWRRTRPAVRWVSNSKHRRYTRSCSPPRSPATVMPMPR